MSFFASPEQRRDQQEAVCCALSFGTGDEQAYKQQRTRFSPHSEAEVPHVATAEKWESFGEVEEANTKEGKNKHLRSAGSLCLMSATKKGTKEAECPRD